MNSIRSDRFTSQRLVIVVLWIFRLTTTTQLFLQNLFEWRRSVKLWMISIQIFFILLSFYFSQKETKPIDSSWMLEFNPIFRKEKALKHFPSVYIDWHCRKTVETMGAGNTSVCRSKQTIKVFEANVNIIYTAKCMHT